MTAEPLASRRVTPTPRVPPWRNPRVRAWFVQLGFALGLVILFWFLFHNTVTNLDRQGIATGFGFWYQRAGFDVALSFIPFTNDSTYGRAFWVAVTNTLVLSAIGIVLTTVVGFTIGIARLSRNWLVSTLAAAYIEIFRNIPLLLQLFFWYFAVLRPLPGPRESLEPAAGVFLNNRGLYVPAPMPEPGFGLLLGTALLAMALIVLVARISWLRRRRTGEGLPTPAIAVGLVLGLPGAAMLVVGLPLEFEQPALQGFNIRGGIVVLPEFLAALVGLSIYIAAAIAEIVRAGIQGVDYGQSEAAYSLGLRPRRVLRLVILPQAMRIIIPPLATQYLSLAKNTSLAAAIAFPEIVSIVAGTMLTQTGQAVETIALAMLVYLSMSLFIALVMNLYNRAVLARG